MIPAVFAQRGCDGVACAQHTPAWHVLTTPNCPPHCSLPSQAYQQYSADRLRIGVMACVAELLQSLHRSYTPSVHETVVSHFYGATLRYLGSASIANPEKLFCLGTTDHYASMLECFFIGEGGVR